MADVRVDGYVIDVLMRDLVGHDRAPSAFLVYLWLWRKTSGAGAASTEASLREVAEATGLSRSAVQGALRRLERRRLLRVRRRGPTAIPIYSVNRPWAGRSDRTMITPAARR